MTSKPLLEALDLGSGKTEHESHLLREFFVYSPIYNEIIQDRYDIIRGGRGSGKSAYYHATLNHFEPDPYWLTSTDCVEGLNSSSTEVQLEVARAFARQRPAAEYTAFWKVYLTSIAFSEVLSNPLYDGEARDAISRSELAAGLGVTATTKTRDRWSQAWSLVEGHSSRVDFDALLRQHGNVGDGIEALDRILCGQGRRIWVLLDQLDEVFADDIEAEGRALRSLILALKDLNLASSQRSGRLRFKAFLRSDAWDRVLDFGKIPNANLLRDVEIGWDNEDVASIVWRRLEYFDVFRRFFGTDSPGWGALSHEHSLDKVLPSPYKLPEVLRVLASMPHTTWSWIATNARDSSGVLNPRFVISLLNAARQRAIADLASLSHSEYNYADDGLNKLMSCKNLYQGFVDVSRDVFKDVRSEYPETRNLEDLLTKRAARMTYTEFLRLADDFSGPGAGLRLFRQAKMGGILRVTDSWVEVAPIFRPVLRVDRKTAREPTE